MYNEIGQHGNSHWQVMKHPVLWCIVGVTGVSSNMGVFAILGSLIVTYSILKIALTNPNLKP